MEVMGQPPMSRKLETPGMWWKGGEVGCGGYACGEVDGEEGGTGLTESMVEIDRRVRCSDLDVANNSCIDLDTSWHWSALAHTRFMQDPTFEEESGCK